MPSSKLRPAPARAPSCRLRCSTNRGCAAARSSCSSRAGSPRAPWRPAWRRRSANRPGETVGYRMRLDTARQPAHAHRGGHRRRPHAHAAERSGARRRRGGAVRRIPRAQPACRHRAGVRARIAGEPRARAAAARDVGHARWRRRREVVRRRAASITAAGRMFPVEVRYAGTGLPLLPGGRESTRARGAARHQARARRESRGRPAGVPAGRRRDPPRAGHAGSDVAQASTCCRCMANWRRASRTRR